MFWLAAGLHQLESGPSKDGATAIRIGFGKFVRAATLSVALGAGSVALSAHAQPIDEIDPAGQVADTVTDIAGWVIATGDNRGLPFAVVDKRAAQVLVFDAGGKLKGMAPALLGSAIGDDSAEGVGDRELKDIPAGDRTTPAGRYLAGFGPAAGGQKVLWVDYATAISIHALPRTAPKKEKRKERLASPKVEDNRITHGCINVSTAFYSKVVSPTFRKGGVFYILPDSVSLQAAFPGFEAATRLASLTAAETPSAISLQAR